MLYMALVCIEFYILYWLLRMCLEAFGSAHHTDSGSQAQQTAHILHRQGG